MNRSELRWRAERGAALTLTDIMVLALLPAAEPTVLVDGTRIVDVASVRVVIIAASSHLQLQARPATADWPGIAIDDNRLVVVNGGYVDADKQPVGLRVIDGQITSEVSGDPVQSGIAWLDSDGHLAFSWASEPPTSPIVALQAGPFLIDPGGTLGIRREAGPSARRTAFAVASDGTRLLIVTPKPMTLHAFANAILQLPETLGLSPIHAALNGDGGPATGLTVRDHPALTIHAPGPVADVWIVTP
jgi:hypothetical protein